MAYKKCPKCELNYIDENETLCYNCSKNIYSITKANDFSCIIRGRVYGTNSRKIYECFCETLGWDINKAGQFGRQGAPLYAENCDTDRKLDVWFISNPAYSDTAIMISKHINLIKNNGDEINEIVSADLGKSNNADRITFVKTDYGYVFLGVYKILQNGTMRVFKRVSNNYPLI